MASGLQQISIGFHGQALGARVTAEQLAALRQALNAATGGWHELQAEEGTIVLDLTKVVYVRVESADQRVGFGI